MRQFNKILCKYNFYVNLLMRHWIIIIAFFLIACEDTAKEICIDESKINPDAICPEVWDPVLGCDEKIYSNSCEADKNGVRFWSEIE